MARSNDKMSRVFLCDHLDAVKAAETISRYCNTVRTVEFKCDNCVLRVNGRCPIEDAPELCETRIIEQNYDTILERVMKNKYTR